MGLREMILNLQHGGSNFAQYYYLFHRQDMHAMLKECALGEDGEGVPANLILNHKCTKIDVESGEITFQKGLKVVHDVVVGADGIGSSVRGIIGIHPEKRPADSSCLHANVDTATAVKLGYVDYSRDSALEYWGGHHTVNKIVLSPCNGGSLLSYYCFFPRSSGDYANHNWNEEAPIEDLLRPYPDLDSQVLKHLEIGFDIRPWRLWVHQPCEFDSFSPATSTRILRELDGWWQKEVVCVMGDAAHPVRGTYPPNVLLLIT